MNGMYRIEAVMVRTDFENTETASPAIRRDHDRQTHDKYASSDS